MQWCLSSARDGVPSDVIDMLFAGEEIVSDGEETGRFSYGRTVAVRLFVLDAHVGGVFGYCERWICIFDRLDMAFCAILS